LNNLKRYVPMLPGPKARALLVLWNPDATLRDLSAVVAVDPAMTALVLRAANSVLSAPIDRVTTAHEAVVRLGFGEVKRLIESAVLESQYRDLRDTPLDADEAWRYALATAILAETLVADSERTLAFTAGLLHDFGRLALVIESPSRYAAVVQSVAMGSDQLSAEYQQFGATHAEVGALIAEEWGLPAPIAQAARLHHEEHEAGIAGAVARARTAALAADYREGLPVSPRPPAPDDVTSVLNGVGGTEGLAQRIRWFRDAVGG